MKEKSVDVAIIGAGTAGLNAHAEVSKAGGSAILIEHAQYGTTCARVGCMPSKLLIAAADLAHDARRGETFGVHAGDLKIDGPAVMNRVREHRDRFVNYVVEDTRSIAEERRACGHARFLEPGILQVDDELRVKADSVVIATGSSPFVPPEFDTSLEAVLTSGNVFEIEDLPSSMAVIGTGLIGLELGQAFANLGVEVTFFNPRDNVGPAKDPAIAERVKASFVARYPMELGAEITGAAQTNGGIELRWKGGDGESREQAFERVLLAAGRRPNLGDIGLETTGLSLDERGMPPWDRLTTQCGDLPIFMAGDADGRYPLLHEASDEGRIAGQNAMRYPKVTAHVRRTDLSVAFTDPQIAAAGADYPDLDEDRIEIGEIDFEDQGRAKVIGRNEGLARLYADRRTCVLIGASLFAPQAEHLAHLLAWAIQQRLTVQRLLEMPFYHPTLEEGLRTALRSLAKSLRIAGDCKSEDMARSPGD